MSAYIVAYKRADKGFSLIELLVAMVILAVLLGAITLAFPDSGARRVELAAQRAEFLLQLACERAEITGRDIAIGMDRQRLAFGPMQDGRWQKIADSPAEALRPRTLDTMVRLELWVDGRMLALGNSLPEKPQVACLSSGELTPFSLDVLGPQSLHWRLRTADDGRLVRELLNDRR